MGYAYLMNSMGTSPDLNLNDELFSHKLSEKWPGTLIKPALSNTHVLFWEIPTRGITVLGSLQVDRQTVALENSDLLFTADFAVFFRSIVPYEHRLFLYKGNTLDTPIELTQESSVETVAEALKKLYS